ncbi:2-hydroxy-3-keto-5-methylthiopentenyl-1-phosphate phosphatase [Metabacillus iocasae]|uniref:2-hydroxy-3-keto-5-methylthiopentenyl-1-phosphate phosphatase n=1 Tax=Priestia iocasae TaxID=2291674 RepID=A0ABS2QZ97_9BACI|nr:2-hydroxy-3-keto-5-methylthiopentenyl-1-phosphate phosphatase [Metabacillus iocasae]MBM7704765.1 2-hydroxy-3-keto-5-methylthiopentenyl-1-phosphate phosphatase [Metabacillus iocasae]
MSNIKIFCDFDGTITNSDNIIAIMKQFAPPEWDAIKEDVLAQRISIQEGVGKMFSLLPSNLKDQIIEFILNHAKIREGFSEFVQFTKEQNIPLYVVSGGIDFFVYPLLGDIIDVENVYCNQSDFSKERITITWPHTCDDQCHNECGCCKPTLIRTLANEDDVTVMIGDSITDLQAAKMVDTVIARDFLVKKCEELNIPHQSFETFYDVRKEIEKLVEVTT